MAVSGVHRVSLGKNISSFEALVAKAKAHAKWPELCAIAKSHDRKNTLDECDQCELCTPACSVCLKSDDT